LLAPFVAYAWYSGKPYARGAAIAWNVFGMADLINAVALGTLTGGGGGLVFPIVLIPAYGVPRAFLMHSYSLIGLLRRTSQQPRRAESLHYGMDAAPRTSVTPRAEAPSFAAKSA
jgi:fatty acid desaturase